jgi:hypothetical protein
MKNDYCDLSQQQIRALPERFQGFLLSPFQFNLRDGVVAVPEDTFKEMIDIIAEYAAHPNTQHIRVCGTDADAEVLADVRAGTDDHSAVENA